MFCAIICYLTTRRFSCLLFCEQHHQAESQILSWQITLGAKKKASILWGGRLCQSHDWYGDSSWTRACLSHTVFFGDLLSVNSNVRMCQKSSVWMSEPTKNACLSSWAVIFQLIAVIMYYSVLTPTPHHYWSQRRSSIFTCRASNTFKNYIFFLKLCLVLVPIQSVIKYVHVICKINSLQRKWGISFTHKFFGCNY